MKYVVGNILACEFSVIVLTSIKGGWFTGLTKDILQDFWPAMKGKLRLGDFLPKRLPSGQMVYVFVCLDEEENWQKVPEIISHCLANPGLAKPSVYAFKTDLFFPTDAEIDRIFDSFEKAENPRLRFALLLTEEEAERAKKL